MGCSSCGGVPRTVTAVDGQQRPLRVSKTRYVWRVYPFDKSEPVEFGSQQEATEYVKQGHPGSLLMEPVS